MSETLVTILFLLPCLAFTQEADGLVAKFSFNNGTSENEVSHEYAKAVGVSLVEDRFGNADHAYYLNGHEKSYINLGTSAILKPREGTISLWFKMDNMTYSGRGAYFNPIILTKSHPGDDFFEAYALGVSFIDKKLGASFSVSERHNLSLKARNNIHLGGWHHAVISYNDDLVELYLDGVSQGQIAKGFRTHFYERDSVMVGHSANLKNHRFFNGSIDDIEIYDRVLTPAEIASLFNAPNPNRHSVFIQAVLIVLVAIAGIAFLIWLITRGYKKELQKEKEKNVLQRKMHEMAMQVMKAQMNPHFIFNAMNSVQQFILAGDNESAHKYLGKFSQLLRKILESNNEAFISLENEIDILTKYIEIESLRFKQNLEFEIVTDAGVTGTDIRIPQMLIQPIVENAIWHGLIPKKDLGMLSIRFEQADKHLLVCTIDDNGIGRRKTKSDDSHLYKKSLALGFISQRLELLGQDIGRAYLIDFTDKVNENGDNCGTRVVVQIPILN